MPIGLTVPSACPSCDATNIVRLQMTDAHGILQLCWCCRACDHDWPVTERDQRRQAGSSREILIHAPIAPVSGTSPSGLLSQRVRRPADRRRIPRGGRRAGDRLSLTPELRAQAAECAAVIGPWLNTLTAALRDGDMVGARAAAGTVREIVDKVSALLTVPDPLRILEH